MRPCVSCTVNAKAYWVENWHCDAGIPLMLKYDVIFCTLILVILSVMEKVISIFLIFVITPMLLLHVPCSKSLLFKYITRAPSYIVRVW